MTNSISLPVEHKVVSSMLLELGIPVHRIGFWQLCIAVPLYAQNPAQGITKELYPCIAKQFNCSSWHNVEHTIRNVILIAWLNRDPVVWNQYFPNCTQAPSNKLFLSMLAERME